jgi:hypothetical protein
MAKIRGNALIPRINYLNANHADAWLRITQAVQPATREMLEANPLATGWYPFDQFVDLLLTADQVAGAGDLKLVEQLGHHAATANLSTVLRIFVRLGSPEYILGKAAKLWAMYHDTGHAQTESTGKRSLAFIVIGHESPHPALCVTLVGWTRAYLEATGCKAVVVKETKCRLKGDDRCRYDAQWA